MRRRTAVAGPIPEDVYAPGALGATLVRGNSLRIADMRSRPAKIRVAASRTTDRRRIVKAVRPDDHQWLARVERS